ncbi:hypothetical protein GCM10008119_23830 [Pedobacter mendelii]|uniref:PKD domain-containing protein n=1 Tax=Pedobacter mendelii TaxID=1908240 RepID=A0ABQ2BIP1_9SPHI|nr:hypothetical protein GCM10008119_23830 [Pedobacter mendelii]
MRTATIFSAFLFFAASAKAQLTNVVVDPGPYGDGNNITATFKIDPNTCITPGNSFRLVLSDANGNFAPGTQIGAYNGFYSTYVNGIIPAGTPAGTGYRLRVESTTPGSISTISNAFEIKSGLTTTAKISSAFLKAGDVETIGACITSDNKNFILTNESTLGTTVTASITDEINGGTPTDITFGSSGFASFTAHLAHYTIVVKAVSPDGTVATKSYLIINNPIITTFTTSGNNIVCLPLGFLEFQVNTSALGIKNNFPGDVYRVNWGDGQTSIYTYCDIVSSGGIVRHQYNKSSCGQNSTGSSGTIYNVFDVVVRVNNSFCGDIGTAVSTTAKVVIKDVNSFTFDNPGCTATTITFKNTSIVGENPNTTSPGCTPNNVTYNWYVDGTITQPNKPRSYDFIATFPTHGTHVIRLESNSSGSCNAEPVEFTICIQDPPKPAFTLPSNLICTPGTLQATNTSVIDPTCAATNNYKWTVTPAVTYAGGTNSSSTDPLFNFTSPGTYVISLSITTSSCGIISSAPQTVIVNAQPTTVLSPDISLCNLATYDFNPTTTGPTKTTFTGTTAPTVGIYLWTVDGGKYSFDKGTTAASQYPSIKFEEYVEYNVSVTYTNNCGTALPVSQKLTFITAPVVNAGADQTICFNTANVQLEGTISGSSTDNTSSWVGGAGQFLPSRNVLNPTYEPTAAERLAGSVNLILRKSTGLTGVCATVDDEIVIKINPAINVTSAATKVICSGTAVNYTPTSNVVGATYSWSATGTTNANGFSDGTGTIINDVLTNNDLSADATVTYKITPTLNGCTGSPFTFTVTVKAKSVGGTTATTNNDVCAGANRGSISLSGNIGNIIRWESSIDGGQNWIAIVATTNPYVFSNLTQTIQFRAAVKNSVCDEATSQPITINVNPAIPDAIAGANQNFCGANSATLNGNKVDAPYTGKWTLTSTQTGVVITDLLLFNTTVTGLVPGETYKFKWTISGAPTCDPKSSETSIIIYRNLINTISTTAAEICSGQNTVINGDLPTGGNGQYIYQWQSSPDGNAWNDINGQTNKDLNIQVTASSFYRRVVNSNVCTSNSNVVEVKILLPLANNSITADQTICLGTAIAKIEGSIPTGASGTYAYQWQISTNNGSTWIDIAGENNQDFTPTILQVTTLYRRVVASGPCSGYLSNSVKITVNPPAKAEIVFITDKGCPPFVLTAANIKATPYPDRNDTYTWFADNVEIGKGIVFPGFTIVGENKTIVIKLVVTSSLNCAGDETIHTFSTQQDVKAAFTQSATQGCGPLAVNFINTSNSLTASTFKWDFGNGITSNLAQPGPITFQPDPSGKDITYTITLSAVTPCGTTTATSTVFVQGKPVSIFSPDKTSGCSPLLINFSNTSPVSSGTTYTYDFNDGSPVVVTNDRSSVNHLFTTLAVRDYIITMTAENACGKSTSSYTLRVSPNDITPELVVNAGELRGCAPLTVNFYNNTKGADRFVYDFSDGTGTQVTNSAPEIVKHTFTKPGTYTVTLYAANDCSNAQTTETIVVLEQPTVGFVADKTIGCDGTLVKFKNSSKNAIGYKWDFGDGTTSAEFEPDHLYKGSGIKYTVTLTSTNLIGCTNTLTIPDYINIIAPPQSIFTVLPGNELSIPNFTFSFRDASINGAGSWEWNFGDGTKSTLQSPAHTYANVGDYTVSLKVINKEGCASTSTQVVRIIGVPGFLYVPNSFMPASQKNELQTFKAKGRGIDNWTMTVFNKWGQVLWETTKLSDGAPLEGWDGKYNGQEQPQGVYFWKIDLKFINGGEWKGMTYDSSAPKKTGNIYLIR